MSKGASISPRKEWMIPVAVAIIGLAGTLVPPLIGQLSAGSSDKPEISILGFISDPRSFDGGPFEEDYNNSATQEVFINVANIGSSPATNMTLIVEAIDPILEAFTNFSTIEISSTNIENSRDFGDSRFTAHIPKLNQGGGAYVGVLLNVSTSDPDMPQTLLEREGIVYSEAYTVFAVYNEGSTSKLFPLTPFEEFQEIYGVFGSISLIIVYVLVAILFLIFFIHRVRRGRVKTFISKLLENITEIRRALRSNNNNKEVFRNEWKLLDESQKQYIRYIQQKATLDYILLDDFYTKLDERNQSLDDIIPRGNLNENLLQLADNALQKIDWEKYTS